MKSKLLFALSLISSITLSAQWDTLNVPLKLSFNSIAFVNASQGVVCGNANDATYSGVIQITSDGGSTWTSLWWDNQRTFNDISLNGSNLWIAGDSGYCIHLGFPAPINMGSTFLTSHALLSIYAVDNSTIFTAGEEGELYRTTDGGSSWDTLNSGTLENINDIYFTTAADGWIAADGGYLAHTSDSGNTWTYANQPFWGFENFNSLSYQGTTGLNPYAVGSNGSGMYSIDGGTSWFQFSTNTSVAVNCINFGTTNGGIMCGNNGFVSRSVNAGGSWTTDVVPRVVNYHDVAFGSDSVAYICGDSGVVLKSTVDVSGISEINNVSNLNVFPNPAREQLYIELNSEVPTTYTMRIFDITGTEVLSQQSIVVSGQQIIQVDNFSVLANGVYFITVTNSSGTAISKVVKD